MGQAYLLSEGLLVQFSTQYGIKKMISAFILVLAPEMTAFETIKFKGIGFDFRNALSHTYQ